MFYLYQKEKEIVKKCEEIINQYYYDQNSYEQNKKKHELFHMLIFMDIYGIPYTLVRPHEPGDFIVYDNENKAHLFEVVTIFGELENIYINKRMDTLFRNEIETFKDVNFDEDKLIPMFIKNLDRKNNKPYFKEHKYASANLLVVSSEYDRASTGSPWYIDYCSKEIKEILQRKNFDKAFVLDYAAQPIEDGPIVSDLEKDIEGKEV